MCSFIPNQWLQTHAFAFHDRSLQKPWNTITRHTAVRDLTYGAKTFLLINKLLQAPCILHFLERALTRRAPSVLRASWSDTVLACWMHLTIVRLWQWQPLTKISLIESCQLTLRGWSHVAVQHATPMTSLCHEYSLKLYGISWNDSGVLLSPPRLWWCFDVYAN